MSEVNNDQSRKFCTSCGAEIREGNVFCHVCGASLQNNPQPEPFPTPSASNVRARLSDLLARAVDWFWNLPILPKIAIIGVVALISVTLLSPIVALVCVVLIAVCIPFAIFQLYRGRPARLPFGIAGAALILFFVLIGIGSFIYGGNDVPETQGNGGSASDPPQTPDTDTNEISTPPVEDYEEPTDIYLVEDEYAVNGVVMFEPGYVLVRPDENYYLHATNYGTGPEGYVGSGGVLYVGDSSYVAGNLNDFTYACTYDSADPRGAEVVVPEACGFSIDIY